MSAPLVHYVGPHDNTLHGNGSASMQPTTTEPERVTCKLCRTLLARVPEHDEHCPLRYDDDGEGCFC